MPFPPPDQMRVVIFNKPFDTTVENRPCPKIQNPLDVIVEVKYTVLCGSDLHYFGGHITIPTGFIAGHDFIGIVTEKGNDVTGFEVGDEVC